MFLSPFVKFFYVDLKKKINKNTTKNNRTCTTSVPKSRYIHHSHREAQRAFSSRARNTMAAHKIKVKLLFDSEKNKNTGKEPCGKC